MSNVLSQSAREAARVGAAEASWIGATTATDPACVANAAAITAANPGAHVCPADVNALQADITAAANTMTAPFGNCCSRLLQLPACRDRPTGQLDDY